MLSGNTADDAAEVAAFKARMERYTQVILVRRKLATAHKHLDNIQKLGEKIGDALYDFQLEMETRRAIRDGVDGHHPVRVIDNYFRALENTTAEVEDREASIESHSEPDEEYASEEEPEDDEDEDAEDGNSDDGEEDDDEDE